MAHLSVYRISSQGSCMITNQTAPNSIHCSCFHLGSVGGWLDGNCHPGRRIILPRALPSSSQNFPYSFFANCPGWFRNRNGSIWRLCVFHRVCCLSEGRGLFDGATLLSVNMPFSGCGNLSCGRASSVDYVVCPPTLNSKGSSYCNCLLFGKSTAFIVNNCCPIGVYLIPNPRSTLSFCSFCQNAQPMPPGLLKHLNQMATLPGTFQGLEFDQYFYLLKGSLLFSSLIPHMSLLN